MQSFNHKVVIVLLGLLGSMAHITDSYASDSYETDKYMLDMSSAAVNSRTTIRVKIFPHDKDYKPQGIDIVKDRFTVSSEGSCQMSAAAADRPIATGAVLKKFSNHEFVSGVSGAYLVKCTKPFKLVRSSGFSFTYNGSLYIRSLGPELEAVNLVDMRSYLRGVVPSEVYRDWPMETLKTQAVAARTYSVYHLVYARRFASERTWDVDDTINFQAYTGTSLVSDRTDQAIAETDGQILTFRGNVIQAFYHADSGGQTEDALSVWSQTIPFTVARPEVPEGQVGKNIWEKSFAIASLERELRQAGLLAVGRSVKSVVVPVVGRSPSGRVKSLAFLDSAGEHKSFSLNILRKAVGQLNSPLFTLERDPKKPKTIWVRGVGFGHGVGMSQQGAAALAGQKAWSYKQILGYYYVNTTLCSLDAGSETMPDCKSQRLAQVQTNR